MPPPAPHCDPAGICCDAPPYGPAEIRALLPHRHEMEMLSGVVRVDRESHLVVGFKDVRADEFWVRGHFPGGPILPGVLMCEAAAQLTGFYTLHTKVNGGVILGLGGIENTRFRRAVVPGDRLVLVGKGLRVRPRMTLFNVQGFVGTELAFHTDVIGVVLGPREE